MNTVIWLKILVSVGLALAILGIRFFRTEEWLRNHHFLFIALRLLPFVVVYFILDYDAQSDVKAFYEQASTALQGKIVYKEFSSYHSPGFPYLIALPLLVFHSGKSIILFFILLEYITVCLIKPLVNDEVRFNRLAGIYWMMPSSLIFTVLGGQEDFLLFTFYALFAISVVKQRRPVLSGFILASGLFLTKIIYVLPLGGVLLLFFSNRKLVFSFVFFSVMFYGATFLVAGKSILLPYSEAASFTPPNVWYLLNPLVNFDSTSVSKITLGSLLAIIIAGALLQGYVKKADKTTAIVVLYVVCFAAFYILSPKSMGNYLGIFLLPLVFWTYPARQLQVPVLALSVLSAIHPSLWWRNGLPLYDGFGELFSSIVFVMDYVMVIVIISLCFFLVYSILNRQRVVSQPPVMQTPVALDAFCTGNSIFTK